MGDSDSIQIIKRHEFDLNVLYTRFGRELAQAIVAQDSKTDDPDDAHLLLSAAVDHPSLFESKEAIKIGDRKIGALFLNAVELAPVGLFQQLAAIERQCWRFGQTAHPFLRYVYPEGRVCDTTENAKVSDIVYRRTLTRNENYGRAASKLSKEAIEEAYRKFSHKERILVMDADDNVVPRILEAIETTPSKEGTRFVSGLADLDNGRVILKKPSEFDRGDSSNLEWLRLLRLLTQKVFGTQCRPVLSEFVIEHHPGVPGVIVGLSGKEPVFDLFEPFATHYSEVEGLWHGGMNVYSKKRDENQPLMFHLLRRTENAYWSGLPMGTQDFRRVEATVGKDVLPSQILSNAQMFSRPALMHVGPLPDWKEDPAHIFLQGAHRLYDMRKEEDTAPALEELKPGQMLGVLGIGTHAPEVLSYLWHDITGLPMSGMMAGRVGR